MMLYAAIPLLSCLMFCLVPVSISIHVGSPSAGSIAMAGGLLALAQLLGASFWRRKLGPEYFGTPSCSMERLLVLEETLSPYLILASAALVETTSKLGVLGNPQSPPSSSAARWLYLAFLGAMALYGAMRARREGEPTWPTLAWTAAAAAFLYEYGRWDTLRGLFPLHSWAPARLPKDLMLDNEISFVVLLAGMAFVVWLTCLDASLASARRRLAGSSSWERHVAGNLESLLEACSIRHASRNMGLLPPMPTSLPLTAAFAILATVTLGCWKISELAPIEGGTCAMGGMGLAFWGFLLCIATAPFMPAARVLAVAASIVWWIETSGAAGVMPGGALAWLLPPVVLLAACFHLARRRNWRAMAISEGSLVVLDEGGTLELGADDTLVTIACEDRRILLEHPSGNLSFRTFSFVSSSALRDFGQKLKELGYDVEFRNRLHRIAALWNAGTVAGALLLLLVCTGTASRLHFYSKVMVRAEGECFEQCRKGFHGPLHRITTFMRTAFPFSSRARLLGSLALAAAGGIEESRRAALEGLRVSRRKGRCARTLEKILGFFAGLKDRLSKSATAPIPPGAPKDAEAYRRYYVASWIMEQGMTNMDDEAVLIRWFVARDLLKRSKSREENTNTILMLAELLSRNPYFLTQSYLEYKQAVASKPGSAAVHVEFADFLAGHAKLDMAREHYRKAANLAWQDCPVPQLLEALSTMRNLLLVREGERLASWLEKHFEGKGGQGLRVHSLLTTAALHPSPSKEDLERLLKLCDECIDYRLPLDRMTRTSIEVDDFTRHAAMTIRLMLAPAEFDWKKALLSREEAEKIRRSMDGFFWLSGTERELFEAALAARTAATDPAAALTILLERTFPLLGRRESPWSLLLERMYARMQSCGILEKPGADERVKARWKAATAEWTKENAEWAAKAHERGILSDGTYFDFLFARGKFREASAFASQESAAHSGFERLRWKAAAILAEAGAGEKKEAALDTYHHLQGDPFLKKAVLMLLRPLYGRIPPVSASELAELSGGRLSRLFAGTSSLDPLPRAARLAMRAMLEEAFYGELGARRRWLRLATYRRSPWTKEAERKSRRPADILCRDY